MRPEGTPAGFARIFGEEPRSANATLDAHFGGSGATSGHWAQQVPSLLRWCRLSASQRAEQRLVPASLRVVRLEPDLLANLEPVLDMINGRRPHELPPLPRSTNSHNQRHYDCASSR